MSTGELSGKPDEMRGGKLRWNSIPSRRGAGNDSPGHFRNLGSAWTGRPLDLSTDLAVSAIPFA